MNKLSLTPNLRFLACRLVADGNSGSYGNIQWKFDANGSPEHLVSIGSSGSDITLNLSRVSKIHAMITAPNEFLASKGVFTGPDISKSVAKIPISIYQKTGLQGGYIRGDGVNFNLSGDLTLWDITKTVSDFQYTVLNAYFLNDPTTKQTSATYVGSTPNREVAKLLSGLSKANAHRLINNTTMAAVSANTTADVIDILVNTPKHTHLNANQNDSQGWPGANVFTAAAIINVIAVVDIS